MRKRRVEFIANSLRLSTVLSQEKHSNNPQVIYIFLVGVQPFQGRDDRSSFISIVNALQLNRSHHQLKTIKYFLCVASECTAHSNSSFADVSVDGREKFFLSLHLKHLKNVLKAFSFLNLNFCLSYNSPVMVIDI